MDVLRGTVRTFNGDRGLISPPSGRDVSFRLKDGYSVVIDNRTYPAKPEIAGPAPDRQPQPGDELVFILGTGRKGPQATYWAFAGAWDALVATIQ